MTARDCKPTATINELSGCGFEYWVLKLLNHLYAFLFDIVAYNDQHI